MIVKAESICIEQIILALEEGEDPYERATTGKSKSVVLIGWRCLRFRKAVMLDRGHYKVR
jgi:hypothetical protein